MRPASTAPAARPPRQDSPGHSSSSAPRARSGTPPARSRTAQSDAKAQPAEHRILFQKFFKSVGPRTYAAQVKEAANGNHFIVVTEGKRDEGTGEVRRTRLFLFSEDFAEFFRMMHEMAVFVRDHPVPEEVKARRAKFWAKQNAELPAGSGARESVQSGVPAAPPR